MLTVGLKTYETVNSPKYDLNLLFAADALQRMEACMCRAERDDFVVVCRLPDVGAAGAAPPAAAVTTPAQVGLRPRERGSRRGGGAKGRLQALCCAMPLVEVEAGEAEAVVSPRPRDKAASAGAAAASLAPTGASGGGAAAAAAAQRAGGWRLMQANVLAHAYMQLYGRSVRSSARVPQRVWQQLYPHLTDEQRAAGPVVRHAYVPVRRA